MFYTGFTVQSKCLPEFTKMVLFHAHRCRLLRLMVQDRNKTETYFKRLVIELDREFYFLYGQLTTKKEDLKDLMAD